VSLDPSYDEGSFAALGSSELKDSGL